MARSSSKSPALAGMGTATQSSEKRSVLASSKNSRKSAVTTKSSYASDGVKDNDVFLLPLMDYQWMILVTILAAGVRLFRIYQPDSVVFDEVHFGGFATKYIKGRFFMDVHPPLAKMLIALAGWLAGFKGDFDFKEIGMDYVEPRVPYVAMRLFPALCGIMLAPTMFLTLKATGCRTTTAVMGSLAIVFENGLLTQARLILLDSPLMIATAFTALAFTSFTNQHELGPAKAFDLSWWFWLIMTGLGLGVTASIKWVGLFTIAWVGTLTLVQLWVLLGDTVNVSPRTWLKHFFARIVCLIGIPVAFYMAMFAIHFVCLVNPGEGDGFMSSEFQATLNSKSMQAVPADVLMGSRVTIRHVNTQGGYLHSHPLMYPTGSKQQQITLYPHKDHNNVWLIENNTQPLDINGEPINGTQAWDNLPEPAYLKHGSLIRLYHQPTYRRLHSHDVRPPVTEADWQNEVSCYGYEGFEGDANDLFRVEIVSSKSKGELAKQRVRTIETKFRLVHIMSGCALFSHKVKLPEWASEQQEVTCARGGTEPNSVWYIEHNEHPQLGDDAEKVNYENPGFLGKFWELHKVMWKTNAGLTDSHAWESRPPSWPILSRGINFWGRDHRQIYLIGNPVVWYSATLSIVLYIAFKGLAVLRWQRSYNDYSNVVFKRFDYEVGSAVLGWAFHYFPFYLMQRQLFLHHYFPALYFGVFAFAQVADFVTARITIPSLKSGKSYLMNKVAAVVFLVFTVVAFSLWAPLAYGNMWTKGQCQSLKLWNTWDYDCNTFYDTYDQYTNAPVSSQSAIHTDAGNAGKPAAAAPIEPNEAADQVPMGGKALVSDAPQGLSQKLVQREETVEYRDQDGNLLDPEVVEGLKGKVEFQTRYETRTRLIDSEGNELPAQGGFAAEPAQQAPPHPDVEGIDPETKHVSDNPAPVVPVVHQESVDGAKEAEKSKPKPASEGNDATKKA
ncbi:Dolichyl-phosphate-mannose--protein mannosyltransferase 1 [Ceratocystis pirilliformis]|uniref:Dolichyl-phosphate-mannose--protein mannosyltransferase n=1 Tax=Ceratocystis pirilliformis TaxID=259994 RepID=A0ABR3YQ06_9PEZI